MIHILRSMIKKVIEMVCNICLVKRNAKLFYFHSFNWIHYQLPAPCLVKLYLQHTLNPTFLCCNCSGRDCINSSELKENDIE